MAKALGMTPEEEHKTGLHKLAQVRTICRMHCFCQAKLVSAANKRPGWLDVHRL